MSADRKNPTSMIPARCIADRLMAETRVTLVRSASSTAMQ
jgi:hypothetical protein